MLFVAGTPRCYLMRLLGAMGILGALFLVDVLFAPPNWQIKLQDYQRRRLLVYFGQDFTPRFRCVEGGAGTPAQTTIRRFA